MFRRKQKVERGIDKMFADVVAGMENLATRMFENAVMNGQSPPPQSVAEATAKKVMDESMEPARANAIARGNPEAEVAVYQEILGTYARTVFQNKWANLTELQKQKSAASISGAMH